MGLKTYTYSVFLFVVVSAYTQNSQAQTIAEQQLSNDIISNFENQYKGHSSASWERVESESAEYLVKGVFHNSGNLISATYNQAGSRVYENMVYKKSHMPAPLLDYVYTHFEKVKIVSLVKHTHYRQSRRGLKEVNYEMTLKIKGELKTVWFGEELRIKNDINQDKLAINLGS